MFAILIALKLALLILGVLYYAVGYNLEGGFVSYVLDVLKGASTNENHHVHDITVSESTTLVKTPISSLHTRSPQPTSRTRLTRSFPRSRYTDSLSSECITPRYSDAALGSSESTPATIRLPTPTPISSRPTPKNLAPIVPTPYSPTPVSRAHPPILEPTTNASSQPATFRLTSITPEPTVVPIRLDSPSDTPTQAPVIPAPTLPTLSPAPVSPIFSAPASLVPHVALNTSMVKAGLRTIPELTLALDATRPNFLVRELLDPTSFRSTSSTDLNVDEEMSIQELVEHEIKDWTGSFEMDVDSSPTVERTTDLLKELELGMWDSFEDAIRWNPDRSVPGYDPLEKPSSTVLDLSKQPIIPMVLDAHDTPDVVMESPSPWCMEPSMDIDSDSVWTPMQASPCMNKIFGVPNPWMGPTPLAARVPPWSLGGRALDVLMQENDAFPTGSESEDMEDVVESGPGEFLIIQTPLVDSVQTGVAPTELEDEDMEGVGLVEDELEEIIAVQPQESPVGDAQASAEVVEEVVEEATEGATEGVTEVTEEVAVIATPAVVESTPEDHESGSADSETEEDVEAELAALEEEHFAAAADDFLASLGLGIQVHV
ncbi:unnamed protein product [Rhizoctonia solani]|uniref:Uncharacterized protein n=1 Tax=Rhizoctonia solani TaxID=456999 RepID=A0A8H3B8E4_9AGAM|nr:unnamed protein product [Rhizoctonia solani]